MNKILMYSLIGVGAVIFLAVVAGVSEEPETIKQPAEIIQSIKEEPKEPIAEPQPESKKEPEKQSESEPKEQPKPEKIEPAPEPKPEPIVKEPKTTTPPKPKPNPVIEKPEPELTSGSAIICSHDAYNCGDFKTHAEAQKVFETCGGVGNDIHGLDRNKDGVACESLR